MMLKTFDRYFIFFCLAAGIFLRLNWLNDMEWKADEQWMFTQAHEIAKSGNLPSVGMQSGGGIVNPGMSVMAFAAIACFTDNALSMNRVVQLINILSILLFLLFILKFINKEEKKTWLYGLALAAVSPLAVLFARKIWAQDLLPLLSFIVILGNYFRLKKWGAFLWGIAGALIGQIHMSGFFYAAGIFVFTYFYDRFNKINFRWLPWLLGTIAGSMTLVPWLIYMLHHPQESKLSWLHLLQFNFYIYWLLDSHGLNIMYSMRKEFWEFIKEPVIFGFPFYVIALLHLFLAVVGIFSLKKIYLIAKKILKRMKTEKATQIIFKNISPLKFYLYCILLGLGVFMSFSGITVHPHYLICAFPLAYIFLAKIFEHNIKLLRVIIVAQFIITLMFQIYVHEHSGVASGDYGITYQKQMEK